MFADSLHLKLQYTCVADAYMHVHVFAKTEYAFDPEHTPVPFRSDKASYPAAGKIYFFCRYDCAQQFVILSKMGDGRVSLYGLRN